MKKLSLMVLMAALALPMMAQFANKADLLAGKIDRSTLEQTSVNPLRAFNGMLVPANMTRDTETLFWDFEDEDDFEGWLSLDNDGDGYGWEVDDYYSHNGGSYSLKSRSYYAGALDPDNWLISPEVPLGGMLSFFSMNYLSSWPDNFAVYVCVGTPTSAEDFVQVSGMITPPTTWTEYTVDLSDYAGEVGCFAIRHYNSYDMYQVYIDDITVTTAKDTDNIGTVSDDKLQKSDGACYTLSGQRVAHPTQKGLYIVNGRKVVSLTGGL